MKLIKHQDRENYTWLPAKFGSNTIKALNENKTRADKNALLNIRRF